MEPQDRRRALLELLAQSREPVTGAALADRFGVTRAVIVQDIALLRAGGAAILATPRGYVHGAAPRSRGEYTTQVAVRHGPSLADIQAELNAMVDAGAFIRDVIVEHPLYGELRGLLMLGSRRDVAEFCARMEAEGAEPLLTLTGGVHLHTLEAGSEEVFAQVRRSLAALGMLVEDDSR